MSPAIIGSAAIGSVCGWWCAPLATAHVRARTVGVLAGVMAVQWFQSVLFGGRTAGIALFIGFAAGLAIHAGFRAILIARFNHHRSYPP